MSEWAAKRFWKTTEAVETDAGWEIHLDGRTLKTPGKRNLILPTAALAAAVAQEWNEQGELIEPLTMPNTRSANSAIEKVAPQRDAVIEALAEYGETDLLCYRATEPWALEQIQARTWDPLLDWAETRYDARLTPVAGVMYQSQDARALANLRQPLEDTDDFGLTALHDLIMLSGSLVIGLRATEAPDPSPLWAASRVDEDFQISQWGDDEEAAEAAAIKADAFAHAHRFYQLTRPSA
ncbi:MAG: ATP12 family chaperone protein [Shimia sp.]